MCTHQFFQSNTWEFPQGALPCHWKTRSSINDRYLAIGDRRIVQFAETAAATVVGTGFIPSAFKYPAFRRRCGTRTLSRKPANAREIVSCSGRAFRRASTLAVPRGSFANSTISCQSAGGMMLTTADDFSIFL